ncbi:rna polymerase ecf-type sigma factor : RNA polymerase sigma factor, sigma-70 family OS=Singulisphaera acidiphila (strain ATCC BAA-1392 / DSM 18658 / VKM B-2454 / MOB10) GN=Sinac_3813 PE=4 SV=1: Sigma70_r2: Sigma70_r4_2 [Gemmataceae bacterium]|nr:rna polymerase ecf-type sigma factor : RNA polymerase sigma factor, sigma-70 family OS=Singulisphaera acidiphila (strain ATCC BAA-1392 / DSM 18658 / VKM B-2454 / MOB10) GN=Sinac_3813 PE=4 SV=1: Sigma70_r2: Sigma70_r4_2 [Gemmataceae bacterium]VTU00322.1 rna polymerase ecf-type sigma factor : RNA polymerase sigma factor, sigma-70 family OS=Singulisphaera acidiphila (strain ATCC BAA-1392 / DSM 18658 / VKM B-2454 / MOB10) GN=Sinac_3813 PE=4 SV=1: Sigma70_r2: Sigma70_r4_2 [Gemmataceae bacterium]
MSTESDRVLVQQIRGNDSRAWLEIDRRYRGRLTAYVRRRLKDHASVEDVVQETFIGFANSLANFDDKRDLQTWLFTIAAHKVTDQLRKMGRRPAATGTDGEEEVLGQTADARQRPASSLARSAEQRETEEAALGLALRECVKDFVAKAEYVKLMALELMYVKGWRNQDVAARLELSEQDVANLRFQAKKRLRDRLTAAKLSPDIFPELQG